jgi:hypothetical protein
MDVPRIAVRADAVPQHFGRDHTAGADQALELSVDLFATYLTQSRGALAMTSHRPRADGAHGGEKQELQILPYLRARLRR